ncbi:hypothetical protein [Natrialba asiatica]|nr:hypothetical protein [Natrialba asiatica]
METRCPRFELRELSPLLGVLAPELASELVANGCRLPDCELLL